MSTFVHLTGILHRALQHIRRGRAVGGGFHAGGDSAGVEKSNFTNQHKLVTYGSRPTLPSGNLIHRLTNVATPAAESLRLEGASRVSLG